MADLPEAILIAGPTASGKSALALEMAAATGGAVINADSMQVYRELEILTARPGRADLAKAEHRLYGHVPAERAYSVAQWLDDVTPVLDELASQGRPAIVAGGTGLYFKALLEGLSAMPQADPQVRAHWREQAREAPQTLHGELARRDPEGAASLQPGDTQRLVRALEIFDTTGVPILAHRRQGSRNPVLRAARVRRLLVEPARATLHARIDRRFEIMVEGGAVGEVEALLRLGLDPSLPAMKAIGVAQLAAFLCGEISMEEAVRRGQASTRQYAKRQSTWFRTQIGGDWTRVG